MKKIMIMAFCAISGVLGVRGDSCLACTACDDPVEKITSCQQWFTVKASGKIGCGANGGAYKTVQKLTVKNCGLVVDEDGTAVVELKGKRGSNSMNIAVECDEFVWNVYGKNINSLLSASKKKEVSLDSEIYFHAIASDTNNFTEVSGVLFGKVKAKVGKGGNLCGEGTITYTPGTFSGHFVGFTEPVDCRCYTQMEYQLECSTKEECGACGETVETTLPKCLNFVEGEPTIDMFNGNISLKWDKKNSGCKAR